MLYSGGGAASARELCFDWLDHATLRLVARTEVRAGRTSQGSQ
jgi:hypothetical protein